MNKALLITRSKHDHTNRYLFYWADKIKSLAHSKSIEVLDLKEKRANRKEFSSMLSKQKPLLLFLNGHGGSDRVAGYNDEILLKTGENEKLLKEKIVYALSCRSAKNLGPKSIKIGAQAYIGYSDDFVFIIEEGKLGNPLHDKTAQIFLESSNYVLVSLLKGHTAEESCQRSRETFKKNIHKLLTSESSPELVPYLVWDMKHQACLGNKEARFK